MQVQEIKARRQKTTMLMTVLRAAATPAESDERRARWPFLAVGLAAALLAIAAARRIQERGEGGAETAAEEPVRSVRVLQPLPARGGAVTLPATLQGDQATDLYPRVDGFVKTWKVEIGTRVRAGQLLAEIDTPELDQEVERAVAQVKQAQADLELARAELEEAKAEVDLGKANLTRSEANLDFAAGQAQRDSRLVNVRAVSREDYEKTSTGRDARAADVKANEADLKKRQSTLVTRTAAIGSRAATLASQEATLRRLRELQGFKRIVAPFAGVIAKRNAEVGLLVSANSTANVRPLFRVVQTDVLRARVPVPQAFAAQIRDGDEAAVSVPEYPRKTFPARVARSAGEIDPATRTVLVELELPNREGVLLPGTYAQVTINGRPPDGTVLIPTSAVLLRSEGPQVAVVQGGAVRLRAVEVGRDHGTTIEVLTGLTGHEELVANPTDDLREGRKVSVKRMKEEG
ncbi:MAG TPA: efflux RND transporter periplasmic adaptor subunit [Gemmataceae bacterium]|nr:efflux RND transporter periplasmic adaptor subunit [Gemmataceae bacterium]